MKYRACRISRPPVLKSRYWRARQRPTLDGAGQDEPALEIAVSNEWSVEVSAMLVSRHSREAEYRYAGGKDALLPDLAAQVVRLKPDVILTWTVAGARAAKQATAAIPVVNGSMSDPVTAGLVAS